jgi:hypothetical protein
MHNFTGNIQTGAKSKTFQVKLFFRADDKKIILDFINTSFPKLIRESQAK